MGNPYPDGKNVSLPRYTSGLGAEIFIYKLLKTDLKEHQLLEC
jgi:hypothetical protein